MYGWLMVRNVGKEIRQTEIKLVSALTILFVKDPDIHLLILWSHLGPPCHSPSVHRCLYFTRVRKRQVVGSVGKTLSSNGQCPDGTWQDAASHYWSGSSTLTWPNQDCFSYVLVIYKPWENSSAAHSMECFKEKSLTENNYIVFYG